MILLIPSGTKKQVVIPTLFKFHYDSINSGASGEVWSSWWKFKFHYDSINSKTKKSVQYPIKTFKFHYDSINSPTCIFPASILDAPFKFHYDSINSRPKIIPLFKPKNVSILSTSSKFNISFLSLIIYFCNTSYFRRFRLLSIPYIFCTIMGRQKPPNFSSWFCSTHSIMKLIC